jgi:hypothetical protein
MGLRKMERGYKQYLSVLVFLFILFLCLLKGLERIYLSDFYPLNGDFQNYNGFRRLLSGQAPFEDFYFYLGLGPLYVNSLLLLIVGNDFTNSLFVTNFLTCFMFSMSAFVIFYACGLRKLVSLSFSLVVLMVALRYFEILPLGTYQIFPFLDLVSPGNSLRMQRAFLPFFIVLLMDIFRKIPLGRQIINEKVVPVIWGLVTGAGLAWSNDFGISVFVSSFYLFFLLYFHWTFRFVKNFCMFFVGSLIGAAGLISILTDGNLLNWFDYNFLGVAAYQFWYYSTNVNDHLLTLHDLPISIKQLFGFLVILYFSIKIRIGKYSLQHLLLLFLLLTTLIAGYAYAVGSRKYGMFEAYYFVLYLSVFAGIVKLIIDKIKFTASVKVVSVVMLFFLAAIFAQVYPKAVTVMANLRTVRGIAVEELGGSLSQFGDSLNFIKEKVVQNEVIFSTYASAIETIEGRFQPSGIDYIIHSLGDDYRERYVNSFHSSNPKYVTTIREDYSEWEVWIKRVNWFFYREFLGAYAPIAVTDYNVIWQKSAEDKTIESTIKKVDVKRLTDNSWEVSVKTDPWIDNAIADIEITYSSSWNSNRMSGLGIRKLLSVSDGWSGHDQGGKNYSIPESHKNYAIPVRIVKGGGKSIISSYPADLTDLTMKHAKINKLYINQIDYGLLHKQMEENFKVKKDQ